MLATVQALPTAALPYRGPNGPQERAEARDGPNDLGGRDGSHESRLCLIGVKVDAALRREIDAYAEAHGVSRSRAAGHYLAIARETIHERQSCPPAGHTS